MEDLTGVTVLMVIASRDFRDEEYFEPAQALAHVKAGVAIASSSKGMAKGMLGREVPVDLLLRDVDLSKYEAVIFVGGSGAKEYFDAQEAKEKEKTMSKKRRHQRRKNVSDTDPALIWTDLFKFLIQKISFLFFGGGLGGGLKKTDADGCFDDVSL